LIKELIYLVVNDFKIQWRQKNSFLSIFLYVISTIFLIYISFNGFEIDNKVKIDIFWLIILFAIVNAVGTNFAKERTELQYYYSTIASGEAILLGKMIYNTLIMLVVSIFSYFCFMALIEVNILHSVIFFLNLILGVSELTLIFTVVTALAFKTDNNFTISAILGIPLVIPLLIIIVKINAYSLELTYDAGIVLKFFILLALLNIITIVLAYILAGFIKD
jgi:heme exporter protein B